MKDLTPLLQSGIKEIITTEPDFDDVNYGNSFIAAREMADEAKVIIKYLTD